jgi:signal peptidase
MSPQIGVGAVVLTKPINPDNLKEGDIITFRGQSADLMMTTHRILKININENGIDFTTKGDANNVKDPNTVKPERVVGKVYGKIEYLGYLLVFAQSKKGLLTMVFIPGILIIGYELYNINKLIKESKANKKV